MMSYVIRSDEDKDRIIAAIKLADWSFKVYIEPLFPKAKPNQYAYVFGVLYKKIAEFQGHTNVWAVHADMMEFFEMEYSPNKKGIWKWRKKSGKEWTVISIAQYIEKLRAYWLTEWGLLLEEPHEIFVNE